MTATHFRLPLEVGAGGRLRTVEHDSDEELTQSALVLLSTPLGRQVEQPAYGLAEDVFTSGLAGSEIEDVVAAWLPRARVAVDASIDSLDDLVQHVAVGVDHA